MRKQQTTMYKPQNVAPSRFCAFQLLPDPLGRNDHHSVSQRVSNCDGRRGHCGRIAETWWGTVAVVWIAIGEASLAILSFGRPSWRHLRWGELCPVTNCRAFKCCRVSQRNRLGGLQQNQPFAFIEGVRLVSRLPRSVR